MADDAAERADEEERQQGDHEHHDELQDHRTETDILHTSVAERLDDEEREYKKSHIDEEDNPLRQRRVAVPPHHIE